MAYPTPTNGAQPNTNTGVSNYQVSVAATTAHDLLADSLAYFGTKRCTCTIVMSADGTLQYTNRFGDVLSIPLTKGPHAIEAQAIGAATTCQVSCFF